MKNKGFWKELENKVLHVRIDSISEQETNYESQSGKACVELNLSVEIFENGEFADLTVLAVED